MATQPKPHCGDEGPGMAVSWRLSSSEKSTTTNGKSKYIHAKKKKRATDGWRIHGAQWSSPLKPDSPANNTSSYTTSKVASGDKLRLTGDDPVEAEEEVGTNSLQSGSSLFGELWTQVWSEKKPFTRYPSTQQRCTEQRSLPFWALTCLEELEEAGGRAGLRKTLERLVRLEKLRRGNEEFYELAAFPDRMRALLEELVREESRDAGYVDCKDLEAAVAAVRRRRFCCFG